jgi:trimeric autotransporter adhesin
MDKIQQAIINKVVDAAKKAQVSGTQADLDAAKALYEELLTVTNNAGVKSFAETAIKAELDKVVVVTKVESVTAVTSKKLEVKFNQPVDTTKAVLTVKRDGIKSNVTATTWNTAKTVATVELTSKISKAEYSVEVTGLTTAAITGKVSAEDERVAKIQVLTNEVPLVDLDADRAADDLKVPYKVENQYGEDITKTTSVVTSSGLADPTNGVVSFTGNYDTVTNKTLAFTIINVDSNVSTSAIVTAVSAAKSSSVEIKGIYNKDGKTLTETTDLSKDKFFVEIEVKDQYGNVVKSPTATDLILSESNNTIADIADNGLATISPTLDTTTVDGKVLIAINRPAAGLKAGETTVILISKNTGKSAVTTVKVAEGVRANNVTLGQPELVAAGENALIPVTALDKDGNEIKDLDILNNAVRGLGLNGNTLVKKNDVVYLQVTAPAVGPNVAMVTVIPTQKIVTVNYTVKAAAVPTVIAGLDAEVKTSISAGLSQNILGEDLIIEDQYGRVMDDADVNAWLDGAAGNAIVLGSSKEATDNSPFTVVSTNAGSTSDTGSNLIASSTETFTVAARTVANLSATEKLTFGLSTDSGAHTIASTAKDVMFSKVGISDFVSYEVSAPTAIFNDTATHGFKVYGVKADGTKALLKDTQYNLVAPSVVTMSGVNTNTFALTSVLANTVIDADDATTTVPLTKDYTFKVVINDDAATTVKKVVTVSQEAKKVVDFKLTTNGLSTGDELSKLVYEASVATADDSTIVNLAAATVAANNVGKLNMATLENNIYYIDQYGNETIAPVAGTVYLTFANLVDKDTTTAATIAFNGSASTVALVDNLEAGDTLKTTITIGSISKTFATEIK